MTKNSLSPILLSGVDNETAVGVMPDSLYYRWDKVFFTWGRTTDFIDAQLSPNDMVEGVDKHIVPAADEGCLDEVFADMPLDDFEDFIYTNGTLYGERVAIYLWSVVVDGKIERRGLICLSPESNDMYTVSQDKELQSAKDSFMSQRKDI